jgi:hypothetical protein
VTAPAPGPGPRLGAMKSTPRRLVEIHEDGTRTEGIVHVGHGPGDEPAEDWTLTVQRRPLDWGPRS